MLDIVPATLRTTRDRSRHPGAHPKISRANPLWGTPRIDSELRRLKQLEEENRKLKTLVADLTLDKHMLPEVVAKKL